MFRPAEPPMREISPSGDAACPFEHRLLGAGPTSPIGWRELEGVWQLEPEENWLRLGHQETAHALTFLKHRVRRGGGLLFSDFFWWWWWGVKSLDQAVCACLFLFRL